MPLNFTFLWIYYLITSIHVEINYNYSDFNANLIDRIF